LPLDLHSFPTRRSSDLCVQLLGERLVVRITYANVATDHWGELAQLETGEELLPERLVRQVDVVQVNRMRIERADETLRQEFLTRDRKSTRLNSSHVKIS